MAAAAVQSSAIDLKTPGSYPIRLGESVSKAKDAVHYSSVRYNDRPLKRSGEDVKCEIRRSKDSKDELALDIGEKQYQYRGTKRQPQTDYILVFRGDGASRECVLEKLSNAYDFNLTQTSDEGDADILKKQHPHLPARDDENEAQHTQQTAAADPSNPFDYRHFLTTTKPTPLIGKAGRAQAAASATSTPLVRPATTSSPAVHPAKKKRTASPIFPPTKKPRKVPSSTTSKPPQPKTQDVPTVRLDRKASLRRFSVDKTPADNDDDDDGGLIIEDDDAPPSRPSAMALALSGQLGAAAAKGPVSLHSAASSPALSRGGETPIQQGSVLQSPEGIDEGEDAGQDEDVPEDLELPSPTVASHPQRRASVVTGGDANAEVDEEDDLDAQLAAAMAEEEESEEE